MADRTTALTEFLARTGWHSARRTTIAGDASNRRYDRLTTDTGQTAVLMDAPPEKGEDVRPFIHIAQHLIDTGLSAPNILHQDVENGFLLIEDLGDDLFAVVVRNNPGLEHRLYAHAVDVLTHLHKTPCPPLQPYDATEMTKMAALAYDWYLLGASGEKHAEKQRAFSGAVYAALKPLDDGAKVLIQRDYHAENLLWMPERDGVTRVGLLDFQDAMEGHAAYDLVSILQDARRDVPSETETAMKTRYISQNRLDPDSFDRAYALLGAQRNLRILGVFARLCMRDGKAHYVDLIPRVWNHIQTNLAHPALHDIAALVSSDLPPPTPALLERLRSQCATVPRQ